MIDGLKHLYRTLKGRPTPDVYLVSYPKSGRTWLRALVGATLCEKYGLPEELLLETYDLTRRAGVPGAMFTHDGGALQDQIRYQDLSSDKTRFRSKKVILLGRNVKDNLVSCYFQATRRIHVFDGPISDFLKSDRYGAMKLLTYYRLWHESRDVPREFLFVRYEEVHADTLGTLGKVLDFMGVKGVERATLQRAQEYCSFDNMQEKEARNAFDAAELRPGDRRDPESFKVRKGKVGNYSEYMSEEDIRFVDDLIARHGCEFAQ